MEEPDSETSWWLCAYYAYLDSGKAADLADEDEATERAVSSLQDTVGGFVE